MLQAQLAGKSGLPVELNHIRCDLKDYLDDIIGHFGQEMQLGMINSISSRNYFDRIARKYVISTTKVQLGLIIVARLVKEVLFSDGKFDYN